MLELHAFLKASFLHFLPVHKFSHQGTLFLRFLLRNTLIKQHGSAKIKLFKEDKFEVPMQKVDEFLINQIKNDTVLVKKKKEIIFIGRSNSGKSSLINALFGKKVANVSKKQVNKS